MQASTVISFIPSSGVRASSSWRSRDRLAPARSSHRRYRVAAHCCTQSPSSRPSLRIPSSVEMAAEQAQQALRTAEQQQQQQRRLRVDVDTALGDETFSALKNSLPFIRAFALRWVSERPNDRLWLTLPDAGSAAMLKRDWSSDATLRQVHLAAVDNVCDDWRRATPDTRPRLVVVAAPAATEAETLLELAQAIVPLKREEAEEEAPPDAVHDGDAAASLLILNGNLVDMGATGLGLSARRLRQELLETLLPVYYLRTTPWGVIFRQYPLRWSVWVDQPGRGDEPFRLVTDALEEMPTAEELERLLAGERSGSGSTAVAAERGPPWASMFRALSRFLDAYRRG